MQRKIHNQTLFVAALSVYLGLLIAGAPPQVLAQTKFVNDEDKVQSVAGVNLYGDALQKLVVELERLKKEGKYSWDEEIDSVYESFSICEIDNSPSYEGASRKVISGKINVLLDSIAEQIVRDFLKIETAFLNQANWRGAFAVSIKSDKSNLSIEVKPSGYGRNSELDFVQAYTRFFEQDKFVRQNEPVGIIYKNTKVLGEKSNFLIVTHLPRAALDSLLEADEKVN
jgi:hypothetical protein